MNVVTAIDPVPPEHLELARAMLRRLPEFADRLATLLSEEEEHYRRVNAAAPDELRKVCEANLRRALSAVLEGQDLALDAARKTGRAQARQGVPLPSVLRAFRIAGTFAYETLVEQAPHGTIAPDQLVRISGSVWKTIDLYSDVLAAAYREVAAESARENEQARLDLLDTVLDGRLRSDIDPDETARILGLPSAGTLVVVVCADRAAGTQAGNAADSASRTGAAPPLRAGRWRSVWRPGPDTEVGIVAVERTEDLRALREELGGGSLAVGMSRPFAGLAETPTAFGRARVALRSLPRGRTGVAVFGESPVPTLVAGSPALARDVARAVLAGVLSLPAVERKVLLDTLSAWFHSGGAAKTAADGLFVHPNTVRYRMRRIQDLTRRDPADPIGAAELYVALETVRLDPGLMH